MNHLLRFDPRYYQIFSLLSLFIILIFFFDYQANWLFIICLIPTTLLLQLLFDVYKRRKWNWKSSLISSMSLCLLLRSEALLWVFGVSLLTILSKLLVRWKEQHFFNPTNFALVIALFFSKQEVWLSPGTWGHYPFTLLWISLWGIWVCYRVNRLTLVLSYIIVLFLLKFSWHYFLNDSIQIFLHSIQLGSFYIFCFFMISDPKTTPVKFKYQVLFAVALAVISFSMESLLFWRNAFFYALFLTSFFRWGIVIFQDLLLKDSSMKIVIFLSLFITQPLYAFCGFYVAKADTKLFNKASKVVLVRDENKTVVTMSNDFEGSVKEFAMVIPIPEVLERGQINVANNSLIEHLDAYTAPRLVEYFDKDPCDVRRYKVSLAETVFSKGGAARKRGAKKLGVKIEAEYTVGEYDILILSAKESNGLITWLKENNYKIPKGAESVVGSYLKQGMKFFVVKVNLEEQSKLGFSYLRPLQIAYESQKFMLPIRLGTLNAKDDQELFVFTLTKKGRVESTNYRTVNIPSNKEIPAFIKENKEFSKFYQDMFTESLKKNSQNIIMMEYAWNMNWCDPCAADPLSHDELRKLGVFWLDKPSLNQGSKPSRPNRILPRTPRGPVAAEVYVTRLHLRYNQKTHPEDLFFQVTGNKKNYQGRYIIRHAWKGEKSSCELANTYFDNLKNQQEDRAQNLASLASWDINEIRSRMSLKVQPKKESKKKWWQNLWR